MSVALCLRSRPARLFILTLWLFAGCLPLRVASAATFFADSDSETTAPLPDLNPDTAQEIFTDSRFVGVSVIIQPPPKEEKKIPEDWLPLANKLVADGFDPEYVAGVFHNLGETFSTAPMGNKVKELNRIRMRQGQPKEPPAEEKEPDAAAIARGALPGITPGVLTEANMVRARAFMSEHADVLKAAEEQFGVEPEIGVAIVLMETALGTFLGSETALLNLASMAASRDPEAMRPYLTGYAFDAATVAWLEEIMPRRADWAYKELAALLAYGKNSGLDILAMPGSIYGAIGICQFMPSNLDLYAVDATGKGFPDLFTVPDALHSLANYLKAHGWNEDLSKEDKHAVIMHYNHSARYANTIMTVAEYLKTPPGTPLPAEAYRQANAYRYKPPSTPVKPRSKEGTGRSYGNVSLP